MKKLLVLLLVGWFSWSCCNDDAAPITSASTVTVLIVDEITNQFEGGKIYGYQTNYPTYNLQVENVPAADAGYIKVHYVEGNELLYYASQIFMGEGKIIVPSPLTPPQDFGYVLTTDYVALPNNAIELTNGPTNREDVEQYWSRIQALTVVREAMQNNGQVHYFKQNLDGGFTQNAKWVFIVKN